MGFGLCLDDVGIGTCIAVKGPDTVVIERVCSQTSDVLTGYADRQILVSRHVSARAKGITRSNIQPVTARTGDTGPVGH